MFFPFTYFSILPIISISDLSSPVLTFLKTINGKPRRFAVLEALPYAPKSGEHTVQLSLS